MAIDSAAVELVKKFLAAMQARDLDTARSFLSPDAKMIFPGDNVFTSLEAMVADAEGKYRWIRKRIEKIDSRQGVDGSTVVSISGTLYGVNTRSAPFSGIPFRDLFTVSGGHICRQEVHNELATSGVLSPAKPKERQQTYNKSH